MHKVPLILFGLVVIFLAVMWIWAYHRRRDIRPFLFLAVIASLQVAVYSFSVIAGFFPDLYFAWFVNMPWVGSLITYTNLTLVVLNSAGLFWLVTTIISPNHSPVPHD